MFNRPNQNEVNEGVDDINHDVNQLADTLEEVLKSFGSDVKEEGEAARKKAESLLKETRARIQNRGRVKQAACDMVSCADTYVRDKPWHSVGIGAAVGLFLGALLTSRR